MNRSAVDIESGKRLNRLRDLFQLHDEAFVRKAYQLLLGRAADRDGLAHSTARLRNGDDRLAVLASLRASPEGRSVGIVFPELDAVLTPYRKALHPVWGKLLRKLRLAKRMSRDQRRINMLENQLARVGAGEILTGETASPVIDIASMPSRKVTGNPAIPARAWNERPVIQRILLIKLDHFGDFFVAIRAFSLIRDAWPNAHVTLICGSWNVQLAEQLELFDEIIAFDLPVMVRQADDPSEINWIAQCEGIKALPLQRYDLAVDLRHDLDSRPSLLFVDAAFKAGYENEVMPPWPGGASPLNIALHQSEMHAELRCTLLAQLVIATLQPPQRHPISRLARANGTPLPFPGGTYIVVSPGAAAPNRTWPSERFAELLRLIQRDADYRIVFVGTAKDRTATTQIARSLSQDTYIDLCGAPFTNMPWIFSNAALFIGCDSGPGHLSALLGTPTLSIYGGVSSPHVWQPLGPRVGIVHSQTPCSYCHDKKCAHEFRCTLEISVEDAFAEFKTLMTGANAPHHDAIDNALH